MRLTFFESHHKFIAMHLLCCADSSFLSAHYVSRLRFFFVRFTLFNEPSCNYCIHYRFLFFSAGAIIKFSASINRLDLMSETYQLFMYSFISDIDSFQILFDSEEPLPLSSEIQLSSSSQIHFNHKNVHYN